MKDQTKLKKISRFLFIAVVGVLVVHILALRAFNQREYRVYGNDSSSAVNMEIDNRQDSTSTWLKRDYDLYGKTVDLTGTTIDGTLTNNSTDIVQEWSLRINIVGDCFINQAWNGEVEIHQFTGTADEKVQRLNLQDYELDDVKLEHLYDGDLLIPLQEGDYVLYFPNESYKEMPLESGDSVKIGVIFYYLEDLDLSDYELEFRYHRTFTQSITFYFFAVLVAMWFISLLVNVVTISAFKRAQNELELRKSGISYMSEIYAIIYIINLESGEMIPVSQREEVIRQIRQYDSAQDYFRKNILEDTDKIYHNVMLEFTNLSTLSERLKDRNSIVLEFASKKYGWCSMRFFAMDRIEGKPLERVLFTVQDINDEKKEMNLTEERINKAESQNKAKSVFLAHMSLDLTAPVRLIGEKEEKIRSESSEDNIKDYAESIRCGVERLDLLINGIQDYSEIEAGRLQLVSEQYSLRRLISDTVSQVKRISKDRQVDLELDLTENMPDGLMGDDERLKQSLLHLMMIGVVEADPGKVKLSIYGKTVEEKLHLLISVKAEGKNINAGQTREAGIGGHLVNSLLSLMGSELKTVRTNGECKEVYFEIEQTITDASPVGKIEIEEL